MGGEEDVPVPLGSRAVAVPVLCSSAFMFSSQRCACPAFAAVEAWKCGGEAYPAEKKMEREKVEER